MRVRRFYHRQRYSKAEIAFAFVAGAVFAKMLTDPNSAESLGRFMKGLLDSKEKESP